MKRKIISILLLTVMLFSCFVLSSCELQRKLKGAEMNFPKKITEAAEFSFTVLLTIEDADGKNSTLVNCFKKGNEYAYFYGDPDSTTTYRKLYADGRLYEFLTRDGVVTVGSYYVKENVSVKSSENLLYGVTGNVMTISYATLLAESIKEDWEGETVYRYDFTYEGNTYSLWYDAENMRQISGTFVTTKDDGTTSSEIYTATFSAYRFSEIDTDPFQRPEDLKNGGKVYVESPISFETWMEVVDKFSAKASSAWGK